MTRNPLINTVHQVFIAESSPASVSYLDISVNDGEFITTKNSGICICTGSGSSSWNYTMNRISEDVVRKLFSISGHKFDKIDEIVNKYNNSLRFKAGKLSSLSHFLAIFFLH